MAAFLLAITQWLNSSRPGSAPHPNPYARGPSPVVSIERPVEVVDALRGEVRNRVALGPIQRLQPQVVDPVFARRIDYRLAVRAEAQHPKRKRSNSISFACPEQYPPRPAAPCARRSAPRSECRQLSIRRNIKLAGAHRRIGDGLRRPAINRHAGQPRFILLQHVINPLAVGGTYRVVIRLAMGKLLEIAARHVDAPQLFWLSPPGSPRSKTRYRPSAQALGFPLGLPS